ncbi:serine/threonine protein kinase [Leifsonia sp. AK011]|uniref:serine/threonine-protein kinase n=1 Tax=Leifsonia sp. AK011 TaxID=2723075 RepID=UPI0015CAB845|nr:serine/threonine-protein kinase [Leifsonia sp. AK011]NYF09886.1 serine/threonine protein kinase [Leifsonia sp. AK011]
MTHEMTQGSFPAATVGGRYDVGELLGRGGMSSVYRADDTLLGRTVAIKFFADGADSHAEAARKRSEVRVLASLNHPALVTVFDANLEAEPSGYLVMEFVDGSTLHERLAAGPLPAVDAMGMLKELSEGLDVVHSGGIVHRDIKPSNVLLTSARGGRVRAKLADFGIAHLADATRLTMPGSFMGTAAYLAPEQLNGDDPAPSADVYSLGLVILEALTGKRAFPGTAAQSASSRIVGDPPIPESIPVAVRELLSSMTARSPQARPTAERIAELAARAERDVAHEAPSATLETAAMQQDEPTRVLTAPGNDGPTRVLTPPPGQDRDAPTEARRSPRKWLALSAAAVLLLIAGVVIAVLVSVPAPAPTAPQLPALEEPLGTHVEQLLEAVSP